MIRIEGAYQNNLKDISIDIPKHKWVTFTGVSGSGKFTLVYDVIYQQAQKEFLESLSTYARRSFPKMHDAQCIRIEGLSPCIVIDQTGFPNTPRSTVGTYTEVYSYIRLLFSRAGDSDLSAGDFSFNNSKGACERCNGLGEALTPDLKRIVDYNLSLNEGALQHKAWKVGSRYWNIVRAINYFDMDKKVKDFTGEEMDKLLYCEPIVYKNEHLGQVQSFSYEGIVSRLIKRKNDARGLGVVGYDDTFFSKGLCPKCHGARLNEKALSVKIAGGYNITDLVSMEVQDLYEVLSNIHGSIEDAVMTPLLKSLKSIINVGMGYITLNRTLYTLSNGEAQKIKLAKQLGCSLSDMIYILDEPSAGLHAKDVYKIRDIIRGLVDKGNTVLVIEHNRSLINSSDYIIDMGPGAGEDGGHVLFQGEREKIYDCEQSVTGRYLRNNKSFIKDNVRMPKGFMTINNINRNNVKNLSLSIPGGVFCCISGVSGAGKSTVLEAVIDKYKNAVVIDQNIVGSNSRSNAVTYTKIFNDIRAYFSKKTGLQPSLFSFNSEGSCNACKGLGYIVTDMHFIGDIKNTCDECNGKRYKKEILSQYVNGKNISDVLDMTVSEAIEYFSSEAKIRKNLQCLEDVGLGYITLGQPISTYSGGELQRLKLAGRIKDKGELYIFDEPTHGLHFKDVEKLLKVMNKLVDNGSSIIVVEHNLDVIAQSDYVIDMGPLGGKNGGKVVFQGTPKDLEKCSDSYTGKYLAESFR